MPTIYYNCKKTFSRKVWKKETKDWNVQGSSQYYPEILFRLIKKGMKVLLHIIVFERERKKNNNLANILDVYFIISI